MKFIKNIRILFIVLFMQGSFISSAQFSVGLDVGFVKQSVFEAYLGGNLSGKYLLTDAVRVGMNAGYYQTPGFEVNLPNGQDNISVTSNIIPISLSGEFLFLKGNVKPYLGAHVGILQLSTKMNNSTTSRSYFNLAPVVGVEYQVTENVGVNASVKYNVAFFNNTERNEIERFTTINPNIGVFYKL